MDDDFGYGDMHKLVLQGIMSAGFLDARGVKNLFVGACTALRLDPEERTTMRAVQKVVKEINEQIKRFDMAIRSASCELTGKKFYIFLVTVEKPIMKMQTLFSKGELELFQKIMTAVLRKYDNFAVPVTDCLNLAREIDTRSFSIEMAETFIQRMISLQYFARYVVDPKNNDYEVTIGIRTIREFEPILREVYDDVMMNCHLCKMIMLHGHRCPKCNVFVHKACFDKYVKQCKNCPGSGCKTNWNEKAMLKRVRQMHDSFTHASTSKAHKAASRRNRSSDSQLEMPVLQPQVSPKRNQTRGKRKSTSLSPQSSARKGKQKAKAGKGKAKRRVAKISSDEDESD